MLKQKQNQQQNVGSYSPNIVNGHVDSMARASLLNPFKYHYLRWPNFN